MPLETRELLDRVYADWNVGGPQAMAENHWHPDIVWHDSPSFPDTGVYHGADAAARRMNGFVDLFGHFQIAIVGAQERSGRALVEIELQIRRQRSGIPSRTTLFQVIRVVDERIAEVWVCRDLDEVDEALALAS